MDNPRLSGSQLSAELGFVGLQRPEPSILHKSAFWRQSPNPGRQDHIVQCDFTIHAAIQMSHPQVNCESLSYILSLQVNKRDDAMRRPSKTSHTFPLLAPFHPPRMAPSSNSKLLRPRGSRF
jgi:hypothetical protein